LRHISLLALALALWIPSISHAQSAEPFSAPDLAHFSYGILCYHRPGEPGQFLTPSELDRLDTSQRIPVAFETRVVPAIPTIRFGVVVGMPPGKSITVLSTITLTPNAEEVVEDVAELLFTDMPQDDGWQIEELTDFTLGTYRFEGHHNGNTLYDALFTVVPAEAYSAPLPPCVSAP
jgi:hypothetical protein